MPLAMIAKVGQMPHFSTLHISRLAAPPALGIVTAINWFSTFVVVVIWLVLQKSVSSASWSSSSKYPDDISDSPFSRLPSVVLEDLSLEELSDVFRIPLAKHARLGIEQARALFSWCLSRNLKWPVLLGGGD